MGGVAVLVTLIYLAARVRQSTRALKTTSYQAVLGTVTDTIRALENPEIAEIWLAGSSKSGSLSRAHFIQA